MPSSASPSPSPRLSKGIWSRALKDMKCKVGMSLTFIELLATSPTAGVIPLLPPSARASSPLLPPRKVILAAIDRFSSPLSKIEQERPLRHDPNNTKREEDEDTKEDTNCRTMKRNRSAFSMAVFERIMLLFLLYSVLSRSFVGILVAWLILAVVRPSLPARTKKLRRTKNVPSHRRCCEADPRSFFPGQKVKEDELRKKQSPSLTQEHPGGFFQSQPMEQKKGARHFRFQNPSKSRLLPSFRDLTIQVPRQVWTAVDESWRDTSLRRIGSNSPAIKLSNRNFSSLAPLAVKDMGHACCSEGGNKNPHRPATLTSKDALLDSSANFTGNPGIQEHFADERPLFPVAMGVFVILVGLFFNMGVATIAASCWWQITGNRGLPQRSWLYLLCIGVVTIVL